MTLPNHDDRDLLEFADSVKRNHYPQPVNDLERTYLRVQRAMQSSHPTMPSTLREDTWEDILSKTTMVSAEPRSKRAQSKTLTRSWFSVAATLLVLVSVATWYQRNDSRVTPNLHQYASMAPVSGERLQLGTPASRFACDFSQDMPILESSGEVPIGGTFLYYQRGGSLMLRCDAESEDIVLAEGILDAGPVDGIPGVVVIHKPSAEQPSEFGHLEYLNITNGQGFVTGHVDVNSESLQEPLDGYREGHFLFVHDLSNKLVALNTTTMTAIVVESIFGDSVPEAFGLLTSSTADGSILAMMMMNPLNNYDRHSSALRSDALSTPGDILLLDTDSGDTTWITLPDRYAKIADFSISPDGKYLAVSTATDDNGELGGSIKIISMAEGKEIAETEYQGVQEPETLWTSQGLVVQTKKRLLLVPTNGDGAQTLYSFEVAGSELFGLQPTMDTNVVVSVVCEDCELPGGERSVVAVNVTTGETNRFYGSNASYLDGSERTNLLMLVDSSTSYPSLGTYTVIDPVSGATVAVFEEVPGLAQMANQTSIIGSRSVTTSSNGQVSVVSIGIKHLMELRSDGSTSSARMLPVPAQWEKVIENPVASVFLSPHGTMLSATVVSDEGRSQYLLFDVSNPESTWITLEDLHNNIMFVEGIKN